MGEMADGRRRNLAAIWSFTLPIWKYSYSEQTWKSPWGYPHQKREFSIVRSAYDHDFVECFVYGTIPDHFIFS